MYCKYCGNQTESSNGICDICEKKLKSNKRNNPLIISIIFLFILILLGGIFFFSISSNVDILSKSVLLIKAYDIDYRLIATGSGFIAFDNQTLITNYHVIEDAYFVEAISEEDITYNIIGAAYFDINDDIAILKFETPTKLPVLTLFDSNKVNAGDEIIAIGSPLGIKNTISKGIISLIDSEKDVIQFTAPISSGSSGGALFTTNGKVIGITSASYENGQNLNLAIPTEKFMKLNLQQDIISFEDMVTMYKPIGNVISAYSTSNEGPLLVECGRYIYHCYNHSHEIFKIDTLTNESYSTNLFGTSLNIYNGCLYFVSVDKKSILSYDLKTEALNTLAYSNDENGKDIMQIFVSSNGILLFEGRFINFSVKKIDFTGKVLNKIDNVSRPTIYNKDYFVCYDSNNFKLIFYNIGDFTSFETNMNYAPEFLFVSDDGNIYFADTSKGFYNYIVKYDIYSNTETCYIKPYAANYGCRVYDGYMYYISDDGMRRMSLNDISLNNILSNEYKMYDMIISSNGLIFARGNKVQDNAILSEDYYIETNIYGTHVKILDQYAKYK